MGRTEAGAPLLGVVCTSSRDEASGRVRRGSDNYLLCENGRASWLSDGLEKSERAQGTGVLLAVADGEAADVDDARTASTAFCRSLVKLWRQKAPADPITAIADFLTAAHTRMYWKLKEREVALSASGAFAWIVGDRLYWAELGTVRLMLWQDGSLRRLSRPWPGAASQRFLSGSTGMGDDSALHLIPGTHVGETTIQPGDVLVLGTDGLWSTVDEPSVEQILRHVGDAQTAAVTLMERAIARGSRDHVTIAVADLRQRSTTAGTERPAPLVGPR